MKKAYTIAVIFSSAVLFLLVYTGLSKLATRASFLDVLQQLILLQPYAVFLTWAVPVIELMIAVLLFFPATRQAGLYASLILLMSFTLYIGWMILYAPHLPCNCGGVIQQLSWKQHVLFNLFFIGLVVAALILFHKVKNKPKHFPP